MFSPNSRLAPCVSRLPARQLGSVATRYRHPLDAAFYRNEHQKLIHQKLVGAIPPPQQELEAEAPPEEPTNRLARLEAAFFLAREPLTTRKLAKLADLADGTEARTLVEQLVRQYDNRGRAFQIAQVAGGYQLFTRTQFAPWLRRKMPTAQESPQLSDPAQETLAIVAYRQPVLRVEIEAIRGVQCGELLRQLMDRELLRIVGRSEELGRPFLYGTTGRFLCLFGLRNLDELPNAKRLERPAACAEAA